MGNDPLTLTDPEGKYVPLVIAGICAAGGCEALAGLVVLATAYGTGLLDNPLPVLGRAGQSVLDSLAKAIYVDPRGNAIPVPDGGRIVGSPDGRYIQALEGERRAKGGCASMGAQACHAPGSASTAASRPRPRRYQSRRHTLAADQMRVVAMAKFNWGDSVRVQSSTELADRSGMLAEVCGILTIRTPEHAAKVLGGKIGATAYLVEFGDGYSVEVAEDRLVKAG